METTEIFKRMLDWIYQNVEDVRNQAEVAQRAGLNPVSVSKIMNGKTKNVKQETLRQLNAAFGNKFNPAWLRGESDVMLATDANRTETEVSGDMPQYAQTAPDMSSMINAIIAANDQAIMSLKRELAAKDETIAELRGRLADKEVIIADKETAIAGLNQRLDDKEELVAGLNRELDDKDGLVASMQNQINLLEQQIFELQSERGISSGRKPTGVAEPGTRPRL